MLARVLIFYTYFKDGADVKTIVTVSKAACRACEYNDYIRTGTDYCVRVGCKYNTYIIKVGEKSGNKRKQEKINQKTD